MPCDVTIVNSLQNSNVHYGEFRNCTKNNSYQWKSPFGEAFTIQEVEVTKKTQIRAMNVSLVWVIYRIRFNMRTRLEWKLFFHAMSQYAVWSCRKFIKVHASRCIKCVELRKRTEKRFSSPPSLHVKSESVNDWYSWKSPFILSIVVLHISSFVSQDIGYSRKRHRRKRTKLEQLLLYPMVWH